VRNRRGIGIERDPHFQPVKVADVLGHNTIGITIDTYSHVLPVVQAEAARRLDDGRFGNALQGDAPGDATAQT
jgi:hypothetical protein